MGSRLVTPSIPPPLPACAPEDQAGGPGSRSSTARCGTTPSRATPTSPPTRSGLFGCAGTGTLFAVFGRAIVTPPPSEGVLADIVRAQVLALAPGLGLVPGDRPVAPADLAGAEAVFLTNSLRLIAPVRRIGGRDYPSAGHPAVRALRAALSREIAEECGMAPEE